MKIKDKISDIYSRQVDELLDNKISTEIFRTLDVGEMDEIWDEISTEMDIGDVWNNISSDLDNYIPPNSGSGIVLKSVAAVFIFLIGMIPVDKKMVDKDIDQPENSIESLQVEYPTDFIGSTNRSDSITPEKVKETRSKELFIALDRNEEKIDINPEEKNRVRHSSEVPSVVNNKAISKTLTFQVNNDSNPVIFHDKTPPEISAILPASIPGNMEMANLFSGTISDRFQINYDYSSAGFSIPSPEGGRISGGIITSFKNTWLLNNETFEGLKPESLTTTEFVFYPDVGLSLNYSLNRKWSLQADGFFSSNTGQQYLEYINGHYSNKKIILNYSTIAFSVKHEFMGRGNIMHCSSINVLAGGYFSVLHYAHQKINTELEKIGSQYERFDLGIRLGSEFELHILDQLSVAPGLFISLGIPNIYKGELNIPGYLRRTQNGAAEFHLTFYYHFK